MLKRTKKYMYVWIAIILLGLLFSSCVTTRETLVVEPKRDVVSNISNREDTIARYLKGRDLALIEGVWIWDDNQYEVAIVQNNFEFAREYDFVGIVTDTQQSNWRRGEVKLLLKETASPYIYSGIYFMGSKNKYGTSFILSNPNLIKVVLPSGAYGSKEETLIIRLYPKSASRTALPQSISEATGFFISEEFVATNFHVVAESQEINVFVGNSKIKTELILKDEQNDLAILKVKFNADSISETVLKNSIKCLSIGKSELTKSGSKVFALGYPLSGILSDRPIVGEGIINAAFGPNNDPRLLQISVPIQPGNSGSPLLNEQGDVIGIVTSTLNNKYLFEKMEVIPQNVNFAIKSSYLKSILSMVPASDCKNKRLDLSENLTATDVLERFSDAVIRIEAIHQ